MTALYTVSPPQLGGDFFSRLDAVLATGAPAMFQLRLKEVSDADYLAAAKDAAQLCNTYGVPCFINDRADIAAQADADGVHIGGDDGCVKDIKKLYPALSVGVSCYDSLAGAKKAAKNGADYVSFGAFFPTTTKKAKTKATPALITRWKALSPAVPVCAIGGILPEHMLVLRAAGADYAAVVNGIWGGEHTTTDAAKARAFTYSS